MGMPDSYRAKKRKTAEIVKEILTAIAVKGEEGISRTKLMEVVDNMTSVKTSLEILEQFHAIEYRPKTDPRQEYDVIVITKIGKAMLTGEWDDTVQ